MSFEVYYCKGGGFVGIGLVIETDVLWMFFDVVFGICLTGCIEL